MIIKLYSIPWICERENFAASSDTAREDFLHPYFREEFNNPSKIFSPPDELKIQDLGTLWYSTNITYAAVTDGKSSFTWYLFITEIRRTTNNIIKFDYRIDYFQTFFEFNRNTKLRGNIIQTTGTSFPNYAKYLPVEPKECKLNLIKPILDSNRFYSVLFFKCEKSIKGVIINGSSSPTDDFLNRYYTAVNNIRLFSFATSISTLDEYWKEAFTENCEFGEAMLIPAFLFNRFSNVRIKLTYTAGSGANATTAESLGYLIDEDTFISYTFSTSDYINEYANGDFLIKYGTVNYNNILPLSRYNSGITINAKFAINSLVITTDFADEIIDISADFKCVTVDSNAAKYARDWYTLDVLATGFQAIKGTVGAVGAIAEKKYINAAAGIAETQISFNRAEQGIYDKLHETVETRGCGNAYENIPLTKGFAFFIYEPVNAQEIADEIEKHGYYVNVYMEMPAEQLLSFNEFYYIRYSDILITGTMPLEARERVQNIFLNGLYLHNAG